MFVGPLRVNVKVVVQVLGIVGVTVVEEMGVDAAPIVAVVGPATVKVAVTVLELGDGALETEDEGAVMRVDDVREVDVNVAGGGVLVKVLVELVLTTGMGVAVYVLVAVLTTVDELIWAQ
jgi:hypothetical protein